MITEAQKERLYQCARNAGALGDAMLKSFSGNAAPKIKRGPSAGHSVIAHRWVDPDKFASRAIHIRAMARRALIGPVREEAAQ
jgi:hypothetical protein